LAHLNRHAGAWRFLAKDDFNHDNSAVSSINNKRKIRYECHRWAVSQTGFDPTQPSDIASAQDVPQRDDYQRATKACLDGRGYSVR